VKNLVFNQQSLQTVVGVDKAILLKDQLSAQSVLETISLFVVKHPSTQARQLWIEYVYHPFRGEDVKVACLGIYEDRVLIARSTDLKSSICRHVKLTQPVITGFALTDERSIPLVTQRTLYKSRQFSNLIRVPTKADYVSLCLSLSTIVGKYTGSIYLTNEIYSNATLRSCKIYGSTITERAVHCLYVINNLQQDGELSIIANKKDTRK